MDSQRKFPASNHYLIPHMGNQVNRVILLLTAAAGVFAQATDPAYAPLEKAYAALRAHDYDQASQSFRQAVVLAPDRASIRKDLAYTLLKIGETEASRDE